MLNGTNFTNARWILLLPKYVSLEQLLNEVNIALDTEFMIALAINKVVYFYEVYRIHPKFPLEVREIGTWTDSEGFLWTPINVIKRGSDLQGLQFTATVTRLDVTATVNYFGNQTISLTGYFAAVWSTLERKLNFSTHFLEPEEEWGEERNGTWTGMIRKVLRKEADVGIAGLSMTSARLSVVDFLTPIITSRQMVHIKEPENSNPNWFSFLLPFKWELWLCIYATMLILAAVLTVFSKLECRHTSSEYNNGINFGDSFLCIFGSFCSQGQDSTPRTLSCRMVYIVSFLAGVVVAGAYSAALVSFLTIQRSELPFNNLHEYLSDGTYSFFLLPGSTIDYFRYSNDSTIKTIYTRIIAPSETSRKSVLDGYGRLSRDEKSAVLLSEYVLKELKRQRYLNCSTASLPQTSMPDVMSIILQKNSPYTRIISRSLQEMKYNGELQRIRESHFEEVSQVFEKQVSETDMVTVAPLFCILVAGILIAFLLLIVEIIRNKINQYLLIESLT